jgi:hypothetical protein
LIVREAEPLGQPVNNTRVPGPGDGELKVTVQEEPGIQARLRGVT